MMLTDGLYAADIRPESPESYCGVSVALLPEYFAKVEGGQPGLAYFDKISFRDRFDPEAEYLCLDGYWAKTGVHRDADTNSIIGLTWKGCNFLVDSRHDGSIYFRPMPPSMHNCAVVKKFPDSNFDIQVSMRLDDDGFYWAVRLKNRIHKTRTLRIHFLLPLPIGWQLWVPASDAPG